VSREPGSLSAVGLGAKQQKTLDRAVSELRERLGERLESLVLYGSAVRGDAADAVPDLNLLILLRESRPEEHALIGEVIRGSRPPIEPFILGRRGFERSARCFAVKLLSIARHYRVLHGPDPLAALEIPVPLRRFLAEQSLRNLRLRLAHLFATRSDAPRAYAHWVIESTAAIFTDLCEPLRLEGTAVPDEFAERLPALETFYSASAAGLRELLALRARPRRLARGEVAELHAHIFAVLDAAVRWIEARWPAPELD
jgi:predicted nucleotidyltransferase